VTGWLLTEPVTFGAYPPSDACHPGGGFVIGRTLIHFVSLRVLRNERMCKRPYLDNPCFYNEQAVTSTSPAAVCTGLKRHPLNYQYLGPFRPRSYAAAKLASLASNM